MGPNIYKVMQVLSAMKLVIIGCNKNAILLGENMNHRPFLCANWWHVDRYVMFIKAIWHAKD